MMRGNRVFLLAVLLAAGCGIEVDHPTGPSTPDGNFTYEYQGTNGCTTGERVYRGLTAFCAGLQSERENQACARDRRKDAFRAAKCPGTFRPR